VRLLVDECVPGPIVRRLLSAGHDILTMPLGAPDDTLLNEAALQDRILVTVDHDFAALVFHEHRRAAGVVLLRLEELSPPTRAQRVVDTLDVLGDGLRKAFTVIEPDRVRARPMSEP
jgi:predicted nuclease of predicted toxin-antitoxin system